LSPPPPSSFASIKLAYPGSPGKMAVKTERESLFEGHVLDLTLSWICPEFDIFSDLSLENMHVPFVVEIAHVK